MLDIQVEGELPSARFQNITMHLYFIRNTENILSLFCFRLTLWNMESQSLYLASKRSAKQSSISLCRRFNVPNHSIEQGTDCRGRLIKVKMYPRYCSKLTIVYCHYNNRLLFRNNKNIYINHISFHCHTPLIGIPILAVCRMFAP